MTGPTTEAGKALVKRWACAETVGMWEIVTEAVVAIEDEARGGSVRLDPVALTVERLEAELDMHNCIEGRCDCGDHEWPLRQTFNHHVAEALAALGGPVAHPDAAKSAAVSTPLADGAERERIVAAFLDREDVIGTLVALTDDDAGADRILEALRDRATR